MTLTSSGRGETTRHDGVRTGSCSEGRRGSVTNRQDRRKLIEVALPLAEVNDASAYDKLPGIGAHPKNMHQWWARLPLPTARAVLFASLVDDPSWTAGSSEKSILEQDAERERLFQILRRLLSKKVSSETFEEARRELVKACAGELPAVFDPFCGGGSIPLEAQRLGFPAIAADLNPVAVLLTQAWIDLPLRFAATAPVNRDARRQMKVQTGGWRGAKGLAHDVQYYGRWIRDQAEKRIGHLYPKASLPPELGGGQTAVITWLWARTVQCPDPSCRATTPLARSFMLSSKNARQAWVRPIVDRSSRRVRFSVEIGSGSPPSGTVGRKGAQCLFHEPRGPIDLKHVRKQGMERGLGVELMAVVAEGPKGRAYLPPDPSTTPALRVDELAVVEAARSGFLAGSTPERLTGGTCYGYGLTSWGKLFTDRQLLALITLSDLVKAAIQRVRADAAAAGLPNDDKCIEAGGVGARAYAEAVGTYLSLALDRMADYNCGLSRWKASGEQQMQLFGRQAIPMVWDFAESNVFGSRGITWGNQVKYVADALEATFADGGASGKCAQRDVAGDPGLATPVVVSTDPPYYGNIGYADLSDFFYCWLRRSLKEAYPQLFSTLLTPKAQELVATPYRFGGDRDKAKEHFESGFKSAFANLRRHLDARFPMTLYYAFKQEEEQEDDAGEDESDLSLTTGWETFLEAVTGAGFQITATWPVRASQKWRLVATGTNALASYIVIACRPRSSTAALSTRQELVRELKRDLPDAVRRMQHGSIAPVDLAQASIGPGMAIYTKYAKVVEADGRAMSVRTALQLINQVLGEILAEKEGEFDGETRWCLQWFKQHAMSEGDFGEAELLSKAMDTSIDGLSELGVLRRGKGKVRLLRRDELEQGWNPVTDRRLVLWKATQHLIRALESGGDSAAAELLSRLGSAGDLSRELAYILHRVCESQGWTQDALPYNSLVVAWPEISRLAARGGLERFGTGG